MSNIPILDATSGQALPAEAMRIAEIIQDFDPNLELRWIPPRARTTFDTKPYAVYHNDPNHPNGGYAVSFFAEADHRIIEALFKMRNTTIDDIEAEEAAHQAIKMKKEMEELEEIQEFQKWAITSDKTVRHNGVVYR